ncbi:PKD domain-containing protein [Bdellovibrio sp. HCB-162]|uniref:PKD domain-containing protein n=1 Tax=Bdellovibrio sp. HCB-162 TaxID=3394234 RepID=UPI0039BCF562
MAKIIGVLVCLLGLSFPAVGEIKINKRLISQTNLFKRIIQSQEQYSISQIRMSPAYPSIGDKVTFFIELSTDFESNLEVNSVVTAQLEGNPLKVIHRGGRLWMSEPYLVSAEGKLNLEIQLFIENRSQSEALRSDLVKTIAEIEDLNRQILREADLAKKAHLQSLLDQKLIVKQDLESSLESTKRAVASRNHSVVIGADDPLPSTPRLSSCNPSYGSVNGGTSLVVQGSNLNSISRVWFGSVEVPSGSYTVWNNTIEFVTPAMTMGMQDIVIESLVNGSNVTSTLKNAFFGVDGSGGGSSHPIYPVAFAGVPQRTDSDVAVTLDGSASYSADQSSLTYSWSVVSKPDTAGANDGIIDDTQIVNPSFIATTPGNYVISLVVSNGIKQSTPSLTVITVGPKDPVTISPSQIFGVASKDGVYVGAFQACNNLQQEVRYQLLNTGKIVLISGFHRGVIAKKSCLNFHFSTVNVGSSIVTQNIPFVLQTPGGFSKMIHIEVAPAAEERFSLWGSFSATQWSGERDLEILSLSSFVPLFGTYDEPTITQIYVKNETTTEVTLTNAPTLVHLNGSTNIFSVNFPSGGLTIPAGGQVPLDLVVSPGTFEADDTAMALLNWEMETGTTPKVLLLKTYRLPVPTNQNVLVDFGTVEVGSSIPAKYLRIPQDFLGVISGFSQISNITLSDDANGEFEIDLSSWPGSMIVGDIDYIISTGAEIRSTFSNPAAGTYQGKVQVKMKGYLTPFEYTCNLTVQEVQP